MISQLFRKRTLTLCMILLTLAVQAQDRFGGLALYTVRDDMSKNAVETLKAVADAGYAYVEAAGYNDGKFYGMEPKEFKKTLKQVGLKPVSTHQGFETLDNIDQMIADVKAAGFKYFVIPVPPLGHFKSEDGKMSMSDDLEFLTSVLNTVGEKCKAVGLELLYHNHDFEFVKNSKGIVPIEYFLENTDPDTVNFEMDLFWVTKAGADPLAYFEKYPGRFKLWHVKDMDEEGKFAPVGTGKIDFSRILKEKDKSGMIYYYVEQDNTWGKEPLDVIKTSHEGLKKFGFN
ncbi:MAG: sugar phosphate isomerase/epimerase [Lutimonas sp.]